MSNYAFNMGGGEMNQEEYVKYFEENISNCLHDLGCQPVLFIGSGLPKRYIKLPSWTELLEYLAKENPEIKYEYAYYHQECKGKLAAVGLAFVPPYHTFAWGKGKKKFPSDLFSTDTPADAYLKYITAQYIINATNKTPYKVSKDHATEIESLKKIRPHAIITTNFDKFIENIFNDYTPIIGQKIIRTTPALIGEVYKIHGCVDDYKNIVLTSDDYKQWADKKKYLAAKLVTFFVEHPMLIVGYSLQDDNIKAILRDIDEILVSSGDLVENIYYVSYRQKSDELKNLPTEELIDLGDGKSMRVKAIHTNDLNWVFRAFSSSDGLKNVNPKILRSLVSRTYNLVRHDIPKMTIEVNYQTLEQVIGDEKMLPNLLGITNVSDPRMFNAVYPYTLTLLAKKLGFDHWYSADKLLKQIKNDKQIDLKTSDNQYHIAVKSGTNSVVHKYSEHCVQLLKTVNSGKSYSITIQKINE